MQKRTHLLTTSDKFDSEFHNNTSALPKKRSFTTANDKKTVIQDEVSPTHTPIYISTDKEMKGVSAMATPYISDDKVEDLTRFKVACVDENARLLNREAGFSWYSSNSTTSRFSEDPIHVEIPDNVSHSGMFDTGTVKALEYCRKTVFRPYLITLYIVGWRRFFPHSISLPLYQRFLNIIYPLSIILSLILLYITSIITCRNVTEVNIVSFGYDLAAATYQTGSGNNSNSSSTPPHCQHLISLFFIPYFLHLLAYLYALYSFRYNSSEYIDSLMEMTFVLSSRCQNVHVLHKNILSYLRFIMSICVTWQVLIVLEQIIYIILCLQNDVTSSSTTSSSIADLVLNIGSGVLLRIATALVFIILILHYTTQCVLIFSLARGIKQGLQEKSTSLLCAMRDEYMCKNYLGRLNRDAANSVSLCLISIIIYLFIDLKELVGILAGASHGLSPLQIVYIVFEALLWVFALAVPLLMAAKLQGEFTRLKNISYSVYLYSYKDSTQHQMNQFFMYATSITYKVRLFNIAVRSSFLSFFFLTVFFVVILFLITKSSF